MGPGVQRRIRQRDGMAIDGTYGFVYCGAIGMGFGVFTVAEGQVKGRDYAGGKYSGTAKEGPDGSPSPSRSRSSRG